MASAPGWADTLEVLGGGALAAAPRLLGATLTVRGVTVRITEVEAYEGARDPGSHAFRGPTPRNRTMFGPAGRLYCYRIYGMHTCANVVCGPEGTSSALLLRAGEVVAGEEHARARREAVARTPSAPLPAWALARGPANLVRALALEAGDDGFDLRGHLELGPAVAEDRVVTGPRVGLRGGADLPWRYWIEDDPTVSAYRPAAPLRARRTP
ncbi:DNA-3-methyladenine glycosylase [Nocardioides solisilvae]|uniref:DNA-3-methyladenine glycosylase n=1 Tax=Nocardioides solisilvae TaxID=1542435 RepID=UPI001EF747D7|nr:DNA-3-methyladenine glycosylase [Nocardioides solisilvae]